MISTTWRCRVPSVRLMEVRSEFVVEGHQKWAVLSFHICSQISSSGRFTSPPKHHRLFWFNDNPDWWGWYFFRVSFFCFFCQVQLLVEAFLINTFKYKFLVGQDEKIKLGRVRPFSIGNSSGWDHSSGHFPHAALPLRGLRKPQSLRGGRASVTLFGRRSMWMGASSRSPCTTPRSRHPRWWEVREYSFSCLGVERERGWKLYNL